MRTIIKKSKWERNEKKISINRHSDPLRCWKALNGNEYSFYTHRCFFDIDKTAWINCAFNRISVLDCSRFGLDWFVCAMLRLCVCVCVCCESCAHERVSYFIHCWIYLILNSVIHWIRSVFAVTRTTSMPSLSVQHCFPFRFTKISFSQFYLFWFGHSPAMWMLQLFFSKSNQFEEIEILLWNFLSIALLSIFVSSWFLLR